MLNLVAVAKGSWMDATLFSRQTMEGSLVPDRSHRVPPRSFDKALEAAIECREDRRHEDPERWDGMS